MCKQAAVDYHSREFLNRDKGMAAIEADVKLNLEDNWRSIDAGITLTDCHRQVSLEFSLYAGQSEVEEKELERLEAKALKFGREVGRFCNEVLQAIHLLRQDIEKRGSLKDVTVGEALEGCGVCTTPLNLEDVA